MTAARWSAGASLVVGAWCLALLLAVNASAQSYSLDWSTIDGGGGTSTGGIYSVSGTIGQPDAGAMSGGNFTLQGGFWGIVAGITYSSILRVELIQKKDCFRDRGRHQNVVFTVLTC